MTNNLYYDEELKALSDCLSSAYDPDLITYFNFFFLVLGIRRNDGRDPKWQLDVVEEKNPIFFQNSLHACHYLVRLLLDWIKHPLSGLLYVT